MLDGLEAAGLREETLVVVASDHGYVGINGRLDVGPALAALADDARVVVAPNGCATLFYLDEPNDRRVARLATALRAVPGVEAVFSGVRGASVVDGTFPLALLQMDGPLAPDLLATLAWSDDPNEHGQRGVSYELGSNQASHGGASAWEIRNTLILQGPGVASGRRSALPSGNIDLAPTVLSLLGLAAPESMRGRVLREATVGESSGGEARVWEESSDAGTLRWSEGGGSRTCRR